jgi:hypothetical protein
LGIRSNNWRQNIQLSGKIQTIDHYTFLNQSATPVQDQKTINFFTLELNKTLQIGKVYLEHMVYYQKSESKNIRVPEFAGMIRYYYQAKFFGISKFQFGFSITYNTAYYGNSYSPSTHQFFLQDQVKIGNYPVLSPFFIGDIKRASVFFIYEHINMDWIKNGMYYTVHYPINLSTFRMGVRWRLYE